MPHFSFYRWLEFLIWCILPQIHKVFNYVRIWSLFFFSLWKEKKSFLVKYNTSFHLKFMRHNKIWKRHTTHIFHIAIKTMKYWDPCFNDWMIVYWFLFSSKIFQSRRRHHCRWVAAQNRPKININHLHFGHTLFQALKWSWGKGDLRYLACVSLFPKRLFILTLFLRNIFEFLRVLHRQESLDIFVFHLVM